MAFVFEVSWEICNKVGGIYTVVRSKIPLMTDAYKDNYVLVGPYFPKKASGEFMEEMAPSPFREVFENLRGLGIECHYGYWVMPQKPRTILVDFSSYTKSTNDIKKMLWERFGIDSLGTKYHDFDEPIVWGDAVGQLIKGLCGDGTVAHFHEWLAAAGLLRLKADDAAAATIFTTHATILGRTISSSGEALYQTLGSFDPAERARSFGIQAKFLTERAAAQNADAFTTVSEITGIEAEKLLGRKPDVLLLNGLDIARFPNFEETSMKHQLFKRKIKEFVIQYFFPYYKFSLDDTLLYFIAGRHELRDKGIDMFAKALARLNEDLIAQNSTKTVVAFFFVEGNARAIQPSIIENMTYYKDIREELSDEAEMIHQRMLYDVFMEQPIDGKRIMGEPTYFSLMRKMLRFKRQGQVPLSTHEINDEGNDDLLNLLRTLGLTNKPNDRVKVIYYPVFLSGADRLLDLSYYDTIMGCHIGIFPSYYEPWGYTPLETGALGVTSVTTDLAGFGRFIKQHQDTDEAEGIYVIERMHKNDEEVIAQLTEILSDYANSTNQDRIHDRLEAKRLAALADWKLLVKNYFLAHRVACQNKFKHD